MKHHHKALELAGICKEFDGRPALAGAHFEVEWGEVHALLGENGAGKSTLMNVACGLYAPDAGTMAVNGVHSPVAGPADAARHGIGMVHQHFRLVGRFTVAENILLACGEALGVRTSAAAAELLREKSKELSLEIDPDKRIDEISVAEQQRVEVLKMLLLGARILILDEPTAVLTDQEAASVLQLLRNMAGDGCAVVLITHKLREVLGYSDRVTVMRDGQTVLASSSAEGLTREDLARSMVGASTPTPKRESKHLGDVSLKVAGLTVKRSSGGCDVEGVSFEVRGGEIYGIAGVGGNGQPQLVDALIGFSPVAEGEITIDGNTVDTGNVKAFRSNGFRFVPADRFDTGLIADFSAAENFAMTGVPDGRYGNWARVDRKRMRQHVEGAIERYQIQGCLASTKSRLLSGGNAQKLLIARELGEDMSVIVAHSPTRGLDIQAASTVHSLLLNAAAKGIACVLVSEDLEEVLALSDTVSVMSRGRLVGEFAIKDASRERIGELMLGHA